MNEAEVAATILEDVANSQVIMMEVLIYGVASIVLILLMDLFAAKAIGDRQSMEYKILKIPRFVSIFIVCMFTVIIGVICLYNDQFSVTRSTLTYFGLPYFIAVFLLPDQDAPQSALRPKTTEADAVRASKTKPKAPEQTLRRFLLLGSPGSPI